jgi:hypothetical protein
MQLGGRLLPIRSLTIRGLIATSVDAVHGQAQE